MTTRDEELNDMLRDYLRDVDADKRQGHTLGKLFDRLTAHEAADRETFALMKGDINGLSLRVSVVEKNSDASGAWLVDDAKKKATFWSQHGVHFVTSLILAAAAATIAVLVKR